ncbi:homeobox protein cut isoform X5 [Leptidea sinapis]|uniref:homeobox protein cut isoform X5 n=1 Tax=Leptidea sinapis TaxID=189913 RepID=UPI0021261477|nr:homeobox protein cut isoform X5 [Leptidea sinapis]
MHPTGAASLTAAPEAEVQAMHSMDWLFKKERIYLLAQFWQQRATLAEKEVTTLKEQLATTSPTPLQATVPPKTNGSHIESLREKVTDTRISERYSPDIKEEKRRTPDIDEDIEQKIEMAATARSNSNSSRSSPVVHQGSNLESELAAKEKEIAQLVEDVARLQASLTALQEAHAQQLQRLEERLDEKKQHIARLEARLDTQRDYDDIKREISLLRFSDGNPHDRPHHIPHAKDIFGNQNHLFRSMELGASERDRKPEVMRSPAPPSRCDERSSAERERSTERRDTVGTKDGNAGPGFAKPESEGDDRLVHMLSESSHLMKGHSNNDDSRSNDDSCSPRTQCPSPFSNKDSSQNRRLRKYENDDIPQEKVVRIYQEELAKIMTRRVEDMRHSSRDAYPGMFPPFFSGGMPPHIERPPEDIRMALEAYHRELAKIQPGGNIPNLHNLPGMPPFPNLMALQQQAMQAQNQHMNGSGAVQDLSLPKEKIAKMNGMTDSDKERSMDAEEAIRHAGSAFSLVRPKLEPGQQSTGSSASSPLGNAILPPAITPNEDFNSSAAASPLQRMASITNSLISQPPNPPHHTPPQRSMKAVLPPITQQQFDLFNNLNTEEIVKRVKEALSQYSISQRLFGESVLGLSQGSVSDLLARPKPWHMLTQKGREPFIRMKMFLEDDNAVHKLVASQYKIAPEKLMRTGNYSGAPTCPPNMNKPMPPTQKMISDATSLLSKMQQEQLLPHLAHLPPTPLLLTPPPFPPHAPHAPPPHHDKDRKPGHPHGPHPHAPPVLRALHQHMSPSVYEMAALTQDLDTQTITTKIKEALLANNIGQKIFGEAVLGLSQGSVSELLSKPKPWHMLSIKGREPFIRMQLWLSDAHNVDRLQALKNERREANKRRRSSGPGQDNSSDTSSTDTSEFYHCGSPPATGAPSAKKQRVLFSEEQKEALRLAFALDPYPNMPTIEFLASELGLSTRTITNWFHNHRMRLKQQTPHGTGEAPPREQSAQFDPVQFRLLLNQRLLELQKERMGLAGVPLPYPPYFANSNFAALIGRGLLPPEERKDGAGLDLSMPLKRELDVDEFEDEDADGEADADSNLGSEDSLDEDNKSEPKTTSTPARSSRRKPAAPQWVNPEWQDERRPDDVIINGVCVMRGECRREADDTVRVEPCPAPPVPAPAPPPDVLPDEKIKTETDDRWEY